MQEHLFRHFSSLGRNGFLSDVSITLIDKTDPSEGISKDSQRREELSKPWHLLGLILKTVVWSVIMVINDSAIINIYLAVLDCFKDYGFWLMDIFIYYFYCYSTAWNEGFPA